MTPRTLLRLEGLVAFAAATAGYFLLDGPLWFYLLLGLAPDVSMVGYLAGPRLGSQVYNVVHTYALPAVLAGLGLWAGVDLAVLGTLVWTAHIGVDRTVGYGLKYPTEFGDTHLGRVGWSEPAAAEESVPSSD